MSSSTAGHAGSNISVKTEAGITTLTFDRPAKRNALTRAMYEAAHAALEAARADASVRAIILTGRGDIFTAGNDLKDFLAPGAELASNPVFKFLRSLIDCEKPLIAAVNGSAIGVGVTLLLHCDLVYVAEKAHLQMPFTQLAVVPEAASSFLLPNIMGHQRASELLLFGERFTAEKAVQYGIANRAMPAWAVLGYATERAHALAKLPPQSVRLTKKLLKDAQAGGRERAFEAEIELFAQRLESPELAEAVGAFFEKRTPDFSRFS